MKIEQPIPFISHVPNLCFSILIFLFLNFLLANSATAENGNVLNLATGSKMGVYYPIGNGIAEIANKSNIRINVLNSKGSIENLYWLEKGKVQLCIAQSDTVYNAYNGLGKFPDKLSNLRIISSLYTEAVHIIIRKNLYIKKVEDMKGKRISIGPAGSGTEVNALAILEAIGLTQNEFKVLNLNFEDAVKAIKQDNVDIVFVTSGVTSDAVNNMLQSGAAAIFELKANILEHLIESYQYFVIMNIPAGTYAHQDEEITTIGIPALLVGRSDLDDTLVYNLIKAVFSDTQTLRKYHPIGNNIKLESALRGVTTPMSKGAIIFYKEKGLLRNAIYKNIMNYFIVILLSITLIVAVFNYKKFVIFIKNKKIGRILVSLLLVWLIDGFILYFAEHKINDNYSSIFLSFWSGLVNLINFGSREPFTNVGRTTSTFMTILWVACITWFTAQLAASFVNYELKGRKKMKEHYIIVNWNSKTDGIIKQLKSPDLEERDITIISESLELDYLKETDEYKSIRILKGNPANEIILKNADINKAHSIIILADNDKESDVSDAKTILILLTILKICKGREAYIIAEMLDPRNVPIIKDIVDKGNIEVISTKYLGEKLLCQAAVSPGLSKIYEDLLTFDEDKNTKSEEIYRWQIPPKLNDHFFSDLLKYAMNVKKEGINIIPIAFYKTHEDKIVINPSHEEKLSYGDYYFAIASKQKDLKEFNNYIQKHTNI